MTTELNGSGLPAPPQNLDAERSVLCAILLDNDVLGAVTQVLIPEDFYYDTYQIIYRVINDLHGQGKAVDAVTLADELTLRDLFKSIGGHETLLEIANAIPHAGNAKYHAEIVRQKSIGRLLIQHATETIRDTFSNLFTGPQLLEYAVCRLRELLPSRQDLPTPNEAYFGQPVEVIFLKTCDYKLYLLTTHWQEVRERALMRFGNRCAACNSAEGLDVHHRTYERRGCEEDGDVIVLCRKCHRLFHKNGRLAKVINE